MKQFDETLHQDMPHFTYHGRLPSLNEYLAATGRNPKAGGRVKRECMNDVSWVVRSDLRGFKTDRLLILHYIIYEPNKKRDKDNIFTVVSKVTQDALQACGVIENDGWAQIENFTHDFYVDADNPRFSCYLEVLDGMG